MGSKGEAAAAAASAALTDAAAAEEAAGACGGDSPKRRHLRFRALRRALLLGFLSPLSSAQHVEPHVRSGDGPDYNVICMAGG